jgi:hypothetical protein
VTAGFGPYAQQLGYSNCLWVFATMGAFSLFQLYVDLPETTDRLLDQCWGDVDDETQRPMLKKLESSLFMWAMTMLLRPASAVCLLASIVAGGVELVGPKNVPGYLSFSRKDSSDFRLSAENELLLFGYGSLLNEQSRLKSMQGMNSSDGGGEGAEMTVTGYRREWVFCAPPPFQFVAVGIVQDVNDTIADGGVWGVSVPINAESLDEMDTRESGYSVGEIQNVCIRNSSNSSNLNATSCGTPGRLLNRTVFAYFQEGQAGQAPNCSQAPIPQVRSCSLPGPSINHGLERPELH